MNTPLIVLLIAWLAYFALHSLLAGLPIKRWVATQHAAWMPAYRLVYNTVAVLALLPVLWLSYAIDAPPLWQWHGWQAWVANGLAMLALLGFLWSTRWYDGSEFLGLRQWRERACRVEDQEKLHISPMHRFVRHPWYSLGLVLIWTRELNAPLLLGAIAISLYFAIGSRLEERKLICYHGDAYRQYRARVPGLIPLPWRWLSAADAEKLVNTDASA
ncbi:MAG: isoprenylcysteine carboxylmethyltransferase family protein [Gammaproteobacteria bacterium]|nr:isoprenylcysteine carboxylmethyltransferase family protein [Gammaproteobacteria bacterium]MCP5138180.1 isoprenylcysteine carboxylmethyltransferase family protein [Gammaproteobacteria bacterium]